MSELPIGKQVSLPGHFHVPVILGAARSLGKGLECRVRLPDGSLDEAVITTEEPPRWPGQCCVATSRHQPANQGGGQGQLNFGHPVAFSACGREESSFYQCVSHELTSRPFTFNKSQRHESLNFPFKVHIPIGAFGNRAGERHVFECDGGSGLSGFFYAAGNQRDEQCAVD